ncbi:MAG TPA: hypothetical protein PLU26_02275 [Candidatus Competibacter sp.]|nr:hypothetical protein [Candidatus Competibacteraceae bacterium]HUM93290.1 hypothetical protein [Candidatus Competibacter sp.]
MSTAPSKSDIDSAADYAEVTVCWFRMRRFGIADPHFPLWQINRFDAHEIASLTPEPPALTPLEAAA